MKRCMLVLILLCAGCAGRNMVESGASTKWITDQQKVSDIALEVKIRREW